MIILIPNIISIKHLKLSIPELILNQLNSCTVQLGGTMKHPSCQLLRQNAPLHKALDKKHRKGAIEMGKMIYTPHFNGPKYAIWGFPNTGVRPKSSVFIGFSTINKPFGGTPISGKLHVVKRGILYDQHNMRIYGRKNWNPLDVEYSPTAYSKCHIQQ